MTTYPPLIALLDDWEAAYTDPIPYAELMDAVDTVDSGKFTYHLGKLRGVYVRTVEEGYVPTAAATALWRCGGRNTRAWVSLGRL